MEVFKKTISAVFGPERRYLIPLFQRPYVWSKDAQWEPLWEDIADRADHELEQPKSETPPHFLGAIVIQQRPSWGDDLLAHDVIDGQQRLTTFQILLTAFHDLATGSEEKQVTASLVTWTRNATPIADPDVEQFKVWPTGRDVEQYRFVVTAGSREKIERRHPPVYKRKKLQPRPRMVEAYLYFHERLRSWIASDGANRAGERMKALRRVFDKRMQLVSIELEQQEDPQAIFETLNARGVPLETVDWPRDDAFEQSWMILDAYRELKPARVEMILRALDEAMHTGNTEPVKISGRLTVEHILPQEWTEHWPLPGGADPDVAHGKRDEVVHDFGNLTLLTQPLNSTVSNGPATQKLPRIALDSALRLNTHFQNRTTWTEGDIEARGAALFKLAKKVWPGP